MIKLFVTGRKDGIAREVEHIPVSGDTRVSYAGSKHIDGLLRDYYNMRMRGHNGQFQKCIIREDRIQTVNVPDAARVGLLKRVSHG